MTILLICMIPLAGLMGFFTGVMMSAASEADRRSEKDLAKLKNKREKEVDA